ncbi:hypothetical protein D929_00116 [Enterococcus faecalis 02-MB-P-10]|uniref:hypothetical protein n=1 Tax=Enterococcus faecalis TaxID=1351 RepID=UPI0003548004|nr:hypothetical protein [Enterococcus faecalis]EPH77386.1 hypothetical protein D929_00116 [Enterococcus faecalis 02-MB-P-10]
MYKVAVVIVVVISVAISLYGYYRIPKNETDKKEFAKLTVAQIIPLLALIVPLILPEEGTKVFFPEIEDKIKENSKLKEKLAQRDSLIVTTNSEKKELQDNDNIKRLSEKNYADIQNVSLVVDGLKKETKPSVALINDNLYISQNLLQEIIDKEIFYEETSSTFFIGGQGNKVTKQSLEEDYSILYSGERYKSFGNPKLFDTKEVTTVAGKEITQGFILEDSKYDESYVLIRLDKQFSSIEFDVGKVDDPNEYKIEDAVMKLELDGREKYKETIRAQIASKHYKFDVMGTQTLKISLLDSSSTFGFYNFI